jgi:hypothetical protein
MKETNSQQMYCWFLSNNISRLLQLNLKDALLAEETLLLKDHSNQVSPHLIQISYLSSRGRQL